MADLHPTTGNTSTLKTNPPVNATAIYRKQPAVFNQLGLATSYTSTGDGYTLATKPNYYQLAAWDQARKKEPVIKQGIELIVLAVLSKLGPYSHPDSQIDDFVQANIENKLRKWISELLYTALWGGHSVSEILWNRKLGPNGVPQNWFDDFVNFHPLQVHIVTNDYGVVRDGETVTGSLYKSGIWVPVPNMVQGKPTANSKDHLGNLVRLRRSKRVYITLGSDGNNPYGKSILDTVYPYHLFKEAFLEMMMTALDRYGTPLIYAIVPPLDTKESVEDPDGTVRPKTLQELTVEQMRNLSAESALVFTQISKDQPVEIKALTTGNNFSDTFEKAINLCDYNMLIGMGIPNLLVKDSSTQLGTGRASEAQAENFNNYISSIFDLVVQPFVDQAISQLIQYNFDPRTNPKAYQSGFIQKRPTRTSELEVVIKAISELTELGYMSSENPVDFKHVRELVSFPDRDHTPADKKLLEANAMAGLQPNALPKAAKPAVKPAAKSLAKASSKDAPKAA